jgi:predicted N-acetyltransferase YhbS
LKIRQERKSDEGEVYELVKTSFATASHSDGTEADYLNEVRKKPEFIEQLSLVAQDEGGKIVGQIVLYKADISTKNGPVTELVLSPICVHPDYFRRGIAREMMEKAFEIARVMGYKAVFLCGDAELYRKLGFVPSYEYDIYHVDDAHKNAQWCMAYELVSGALDGVSGTVDIL